MCDIDKAKLNIAIDALSEIAATKMILKGKTSSYGRGFRNFTVKDAKRIASAAANRIDLYERDEVAHNAAVHRRGPDKE